MLTDDTIKRQHGYQHGQHITVEKCFCRSLPCGTHANAAATLMRLGAQDAEACDYIRQSGAFASLADMLSCDAGPCRYTAAAAFATRNADTSLLSIQRQQQHQ